MKVISHRMGCFFLSVHTSQWYCMSSAVLRVDTTCTLYVPVVYAGLPEAYEIL